MNVIVKRAGPKSCSLLFHMDPCIQILSSKATSAGVEALSSSFWKAGCKPVDAHGDCMKPIGLVAYPCLLINYFLPPSCALVYYCFWMLGLLAGGDTAFHPKIFQCSFLNIHLGIYVWCFLAWDLTSGSCLWSLVYDKSIFSYLSGKNNAPIKYNLLNA